MSALTRRNCLQLGFRAALPAALACARSPIIPIIDTHIHLFDQTRPQGAPYSAAPGNTEPALPARYRALARPLGIVGAIEIEASPWIEDNLWVLEVEQNAPIMVGAVGNLRPEKPEFAEYLDRYRKNKLFLGIRYGNLWGYDIAAQSQNPAFLSGLKLLQQAGLVLDTANPNPLLMEAVLRISDRIPGLRIVLDHVPSMLSQFDAAGQKAIEPTFRELANRKEIYVKVSEVIKIENGKAVTDLRAYKPTLDYLFETFGEDRLLFGSDWPNGSAVNNLPAIVSVVKQYFAGKSRIAAEKYFWRNSAAAYRWIRRAADQPEAAWRPSDNPSGLH
jgi:L-fuconolactonase